MKKIIKNKIKEYYSIENVIFLVFALFFLIVLTIYFSNFQTNNPVDNISSDIQKFMESDDKNQPLNYIYLSQGDIFCEYSTLKLYIYKNNLLIKNNQEQYYFLIDDNLLTNTLNLNYSPNNEIFFKQLGKPLYCNINSAVSKEFYKESFELLVNVIN